MKGQEIKRRITGAEETVKITGAMQLVAASKMARAQSKTESSRSFVHEIKTIITMLGPLDKFALCKVKNPKAKKVCIVITSDKGLCGDYNHKVLEYADEEIKKNGYVEIYAIGHYCREHFHKKKMAVSNAFVYLMHEPFVDDAMKVTESITKDFLNGKTSQVDIIYTYVEEGYTSKKHLVTKTLLPIETPSQQLEKPLVESKEEIDKILYNYIWSRIYFALSSSSLALNNDRMVAMQTATNNGKELKQRLNTQYNKIRQESITNDLIDATIAKQGRNI
ncbi:MAG: F0F1 ATP synthase subunit gamma [Clostridia bacterium]|nr:F0F1 ATP synthase subunit gamma [Clostridia bacterium]